MPECDDVVDTRSHAREQDRLLICFCAGVRKKAFLQYPGSNPRQFFREIDHGRVGIKRGGVLQAVDLGLDFGSDLGVSVPDGDGQDAAKKIEVLPSLEVPQVLHGAAVRDKRALVKV